MASLIEKRIAALETRTSSASRMMHFIKARDVGDKERQIAELVASGRCGPFDGIIALTGWSPT